MLFYIKKKTLDCRRESISLSTENTFISFLLVCDKDSTNYLLQYVNQIENNGIKSSVLAVTFWGSFFRN